jgi:tetratricopeptide (TPR) repeat protein
LEAIAMNLELETRTELVVLARLSHSRRDWHASYAGFDRASELGPLDIDDLDAMSTAAWRLGHAKESVRIAELVFTQLARRDLAAAATKAADIALAWLTRGDVNIGQGWMSRSRRLLDGTPEGVTHGYLGYLDVIHAVTTRAVEGISEPVRYLRELSVRLDDPAVTALALVAQGLEAILDARVAEAYRHLDEVMPSLLADELPIEWAGDVYCIVLHHWHKLGDQPRMRAWMRSMEQWCERAGAVSYGGVCDVHRLQLRAGGDDYRRLEGLLLNASNALESVNNRAAADGFYELGEVRRLLGDADAAMAAFAKSRALGRDPQPGEAMLRGGQGDKQAAWTGLRLALAGQPRIDRMNLLRGAVQLALTREEFDEAESHCREMESGADAFGTPGFLAWATHARGAVLVRRGELQAALVALQAALPHYRAQQSRYETAEVYEWMALAHRGLGDEAAAASDAATADDIYHQLGVEPTGLA